MPTPNDDLSAPVRAAGQSSGAMMERAATVWGRAAHRFKAMKPYVSTPFGGIADGSTFRFWGIGSRDLGNVPKSALEHPR